MIRILDGKNMTGDTADYKIFIGREYDSFEDFVKSVSHTYFITDVGAVKDDITVGYVDLENRLIFTEKAILWFEDVNIINSRKYQKYL